MSINVRLCSHYYCAKMKPMIVQYSSTPSLTQTLNKQNIFNFKIIY